MIGVIIRSYHLTKYLKAVLKSLKDLDVIIVANYRFKGAEPKPDNTKEIIESLNQKNIIFESGEGKEQHEVFNDCLGKLTDCSYVFINDADEFLLKKDREEILETMINRNKDTGFCFMKDYASYTQCYPIRNYRPIMIIKPKIRFYEVRNAWHGEGCFFDKYIHHFCYLLNENDIKWKEGWHGAFKEVNRIISQEKNDCKIPEEIMNLLEDK